jgi:hypothetical protein
VAYTVTLDGLQPPPDVLQKGVVIEWLQISPTHDVLLVLASIEVGGRWQSSYVMVKLMAGPPISTDSESDKVSWYCNNTNKIVVMKSQVPSIF